MKEVLDRLIDDFQERSLPDLLPRERTITSLAGKAQVVVGMRRTGKTWFCFQRMKELMAQGIPKERLLYINFEDERLLPFEARHFQDILEVFFRKNPTLKNQGGALFLDEVQRIPGWDRFVRRLLDSERLEVWVTGSSSKLLSAEIATSLRGRSLTTEIFPFSFREFLAFQGTPVTSSRFGAQARAMLQHQMDRYLAVGGFPEVQQLDEDPRHQVLRNYLDVVILRDVIERHSVKNVVALRALIRHLMAAPSTRFSVNKFYGSLKSQGIACAKNDLHEFLDHLMDAFLFYPVPIHARSYKARQVNPRKIYVIDCGLLNSMSYQMTKDRGALLENLVYLHLRRQGVFPEYYLTDSGEEVDFVIPHTGRQEKSLIQVCWSLEDRSTREREMKSLHLAMKELRLKRGTIVTFWDEPSHEDNIEIIPVWKWLLDMESI